MVKAGTLLRSAVAYPNHDARDTIGAQLLKAQDTVAICAPIVSQHLALFCLEAGPEALHERIEGLEGSVSMTQCPRPSCTHT
jgi:hypothetical protein